MLTFSSIFATVSASDELPESWWAIAFTAFILGCLLACVVLVTSLLTRPRATWFVPTTFAAMIISLVAFAFAAHIYAIDHIPIAIDGAKNSQPFWRLLAVPSLPLITSLSALAVYHRRLSTT